MILRTSFLRALILRVLFALGVVGSGSGLLGATLKWKNVLNQSEAWYASEEATRLADTVILYQTDSGGWPKNTDMTEPPGEAFGKLSDSERAPTIDNSATTRPLRFLAKVHAANPDSRWTASLRRGLSYLLEAQYPNGGWPQFYPLRAGYYSRITYNDDAMVKVLELLRSIERREEDWNWVDPLMRQRISDALARGIACILATQVRVDSRLTVWCAQHDEITLRPAPARAYELVSLSGAESVGVVRFLMGIEDPSKEVEAAVEAAVEWFRRVAISGKRKMMVKNDQGESIDQILVDDPNVDTWARFYEIGSDRPIFVGRSGEVHYTLAEVEQERRTGYSYYGEKAKDLIGKEWQEWRQRLANRSKASLAFPGAEGFGAYAQGGRGGDVYTVTNIKDSGRGSLREGIRSAKGPRTIVFAVSGLIHLKSKLIVDSDYLTIAGQTAPGDGICLRNYTFEIRANHVIVRYMRSRLGDTAGQVTDAISINEGRHIILDHCSASWSVDETLSCQSGKVDMLTVQWCMVSESLRDSIHHKGPHGYGGIIGSLRQSYHHNLFAHHSSRNPKITGRRHCEVDFRNNVIYNWGFNSCYDATASHVNWVNNYYRAGPATRTGVSRRIFKLSDQDIAAGGPNSPEDSLAYETSFFAEGNYVYGHEEVTADNWDGGIEFEDGATEAVNRARVPFDFPAIKKQTAEEAYPLVLAGAGASFARDGIDERIAYEAAVGEARWGENGLIDTPADVGGWPQYRSESAPPRPPIVCFPYPSAVGNASCF